LERKVQIYSASKVAGTSSTPILFRVTKVNTLMDFMILEAEAVISEDAPCLRSPFMGQDYFQATLISPSSTPSFQDGVITSVTLSKPYFMGRVKQKVDGQIGCGCFDSAVETPVVGYEQSDSPSGSCISRMVVPGSFF
jgi:hypothetical protein